MGLSSSQARLLMLTASINDLEYQETMIAQRKQQLAQKSEIAAKDYNAAISNYTMKIKMPDTSTTTGTSSQKLTYDNLKTQGYLVTDGADTLYLMPSKAQQEWDKYNNLSEAEKKEQYTDKNIEPPKEPQGNDKWDIPSGVTIDKDGKATISNGKNKTSFTVADGSAYLSKPEFLQTAIETGRVQIMDTRKSDDEGKMDLSMLASDTNFEYVLDTTDDAVASSKYEYETAKISRQDSRLDMELQQLETQHNAKSKEYDSTKDVIKSNIDRTFKLDANG